MNEQFEKFKNDLLFLAIHKEERSNHTSELLEQARWLIKYKYPLQDHDPAYSIYIQLALSVGVKSNLIRLCEWLKERDYKLQWSVQVEENYYQNCFTNEIKQIRVLMRKLRPLVLDYTKTWSEERKKSDINNSDYGKYFKNWYLKNPA